MQEICNINFSLPLYILQDWFSGVNGARKVFDILLTSFPSSFWLRKYLYVIQFLNKGLVFYQEISIYIYWLLMSQEHLFLYADAEIYSSMNSD